MPSSVLGAADIAVKKKESSALGARANILKVHTGGKQSSDDKWCEKVKAG